MKVSTLKVRCALPGRAYISRDLQILKPKHTDNIVRGSHV